jgi:hypothetical protein
MIKTNKKNKGESRVRRRIEKEGERVRRRKTKGEDHKVRKTEKYRGNLIMIM